jgi:hypothetical protein
LALGVPQSETIDTSTSLENVNKIDNKCDKKNLVYNYPNQPEEKVKT